MDGDHGSELSGEGEWHVCCKRNRGRNRSKNHRHDNMFEAMATSLRDYAEFCLCSKRKPPRARFFFALLRRNVLCTRFWKGLYQRHSCSESQCSTCLSCRHPDSCLEGYNHEQSRRVPCHFLNNNILARGYASEAVAAGQIRYVSL